MFADTMIVCEGVGDLITSEFWIEWPAYDIAWIDLIELFDIDELFEHVFLTVRQVGVIYPTYDLIIQRKNKARDDQRYVIDLASVLYP